MGKRNLEKSKGFSLIELLATIVIITLVVSIAGYTVTKIINSSKENSEIITLNNIKSSARYYTEENSRAIVWKKDKNNSNQTYSCVSVDTLLDNGYLQKNVLKDYDGERYVLIKKEKNQGIISEEMDSGKVCGLTANQVVIPTNELCNDLTYSGVFQQLTEYIETDKYKFSNYSKKDAGVYTVKATLKSNAINEGYIWEDGSTDEKKIVCRIKRAIPDISIDPNGSNNINSVTPISTNFKSNIKGTISLKSSNSNFVMATVDDVNVVANVNKRVMIQPLSIRDVDSYITITFNPEDINNYYSTSVIFNLKKVELIGVAKPTEKSHCNSSLVYNNTTQMLVKKANEGYSFSNTMEMDAGTYDVIATLKYGYTWKDGTTDPVKIKCAIAKAIPELTLNKYEDKIYKTKSTTVVASSNVEGIISVKGSTKYVTYNASSDSIKNNETSTITINGINVVDTTPITITLNPVDQKNYISRSVNYKITVLSNIFKLTYDSNGGTECSPGNKNITLDKPYGTLCTPTRTGYIFDGWYTKKSSGVPVDKDTITTVGDKTIYAHWKANTYTITYKLGNLEGKTIEIGKSTCVYDSECTIKKWEVISKEKSIVFPYSYSKGKKTDETWEFAGWSDNETGLSIKYKDGKIFEKWNNVNDITLYAIGSKNFYFYSGIRPKKRLIYKTQYWNPYSTNSAYLTDIEIPKATTIDYGWSFIGYAAGSSVASIDAITYDKDVQGTKVKPSCLAFPYIRSVYKRNINLKYNKNGGDGTNFTSSVIQYYNSGYAEDGVNKESKISVPSFVLEKNTFTRTGYAFVGWSTSSNSTTAKYKVGSKYDEFVPEVDSEETTKTMYAIWENNTYTISYKMNNGINNDNNPKSATYDDVFQLVDPIKSVTITGDENGTGATISVDGTKDVHSVAINPSFSGWSSSSSNGLSTKTSQTGDKTTTMSQWLGDLTKNTYFKNLSLMSGTVTLTANWTSENVVLPKVTKDGYTCWWNTDKNGNGTSYSSESTYTVSGTSNNSIALYAKCSPNTYKVIFDKNGGTGGSDGPIYQKYSVGWYSNSNTTTSISKITPPTRVGYKFDGYYYTNSKKEKKKIIDNDGNIVVGNTAFIGSPTLVAEWIENTYVISYSLNGGSVGEKAPVTATYDQVSQISNPKKTVTVTGNENGTGATISVNGTKDVHSVSTKPSFSGWSSSSSNGLSTKTAQTGDKTTTMSQWLGGITKNTYFKNLSLMSGTVTLTANWTSENVVLPKVTKDGYTCWWNTDKNGNGTTYNSNGTYTVSGTSNNSIALYAKCSPNTYKVTFDKNGGTGGSNGPIYQKYSVGWYSNSNTTTSISKITPPTRVGYKFDGYHYTNSNNNEFTVIDSSGKIVSENTTFSGDREIYAKWVSNIYKITLDKKGGTGGSNGPIYQKYSVGWYSDSNAATLVSEITPPTRVGYTFEGYFYTDSNNDELKIIDSSGKIVVGVNSFTGNQTIYAKWKINTVTIYFSTNGGDIKGTTTSEKGDVYTWTTEKVKINDTTYSNIIKRSKNGGTSKTYTYTYKYGETVNDLPKARSSEFIYITKNNYSPLSSAKHWVCKSNNCVNDTYDQAKEDYTVADYCDVSKESCNVVLGVNWDVNRIKIYYSAKDGIVASTTVNKRKTATYTWGTKKVEINGTTYSNIITRNGDTLIRTYKATSTASVDLADYNNGNALKITRHNYIGTSGAEWQCLSKNCINNTYDQGVDYEEATGYCDAKLNDCSIVLGVNWSLFLPKARTNMKWYVFKEPGHVNGVNNDSDQHYNYNTSTPYNHLSETYRSVALGTYNGIVYLSTINGEKNIKTYNSNVHFMKIYIPSVVSEVGMKAKLTDITDTQVIDGKTYYAVWIKTGCKGIDCPDDYVSVK